MSGVSPSPPSQPSHAAAFSGVRAVLCLRKWWVWGARRLVPFSRALFRRRVTLGAGQAQGQPGCTRPRSSTQSTPPVSQTTVNVATSTSSHHDNHTIATESIPQNNETYNPKLFNFYPPRRAAKMALDSFFHNKIESMKLEIIQGQAVLRRLEAQRNDYNSRGKMPDFEVAATC